MALIPQDQIGKIGFFVKSLGLLLLAAMIGVAVLTGPEGGTGRCVATDSVEVTGCRLDITEPLEVRIQRDLLFAADRRALEEAQQRVDAAREAAAAAQGAANIEAAEERLATAEATLAALPTIRTLALYVDGAAAPATVKFDISQRAGDGWAELSFVMDPPLNASTDEGKAWRKLLAGGSGWGRRTIALGLGDPAAQVPLPGSVVTGVTLTVFRPWVVALAAVGLLGIIVGIAVQYWNTGLLRERTPAAAADHPPFSLSRVQAFWWAALIAGGYIFVMLVTRQYAGIVTTSALGLIGISGSTLLVARGIDELNAPESSRQTLGFFRDLMSSGDTVALQRLQMLAWTLILGAIFAYVTLRTLVFPDFDANLLILAGLVSMTYAGFKLPENAKAAKAAP